MSLVQFLSYLKLAPIPLHEQVCHVTEVAPRVLPKELRVLSPPPLERVLLIAVRTPYCPCLSPLTNRYTRTGGCDPFAEIRTAFNELETESREVLEAFEASVQTSGRVAARCSFCPLGNLNFPRFGSLGPALTAERSWNPSSNAVFPEALESLVKNDREERKWQLLHAAHAAQPTPNRCIGIKQATRPSEHNMVCRPCHSRNNTMLGMPIGN